MKLFEIITHYYDIQKDSKFIKETKKNNIYVFNGINEEEKL